MKKFIVTGMGCAACQSRVENAVKQLPGVEEVSVSLLTNAMQVEGNVDEQLIIDAVEKAGYGITTDNETSKKKQQNDIIANEDEQVCILSKRLIVSCILLIPLMYFSMGYSMWEFPVPKLFKHNLLASGILQLLLSLSILIINRKFFVNGAKGAMHRSPNMDTLVALGSGVSFGYSVYTLFSIANDHVLEHHNVMEKGIHNLYFESAAMIVTLITVGKLLEARAKGKTTNAIKGLMNLAPKMAVLVETSGDGKEIEKEVPVEDIRVGDIFAVKPGESIPVDGIVLDGFSAVDESALTGESIPIDKNIGSHVFSATINQSGYLKCEAIKVGRDTTLSKIIQMVTDASATKAPIAKVADRVSGIFVPIVILIAIVTFLVWILTGAGISFALSKGIAVLVISCPCALGLATPVAIMVGSGIGAKNGILFKNATALETAGKIQIVALDKTGTITLGKPKVTDIFPNDGIEESELLINAYTLESKSEHPLSKAIVQYADEKKIEKSEVNDFKISTGYGLSGVINGVRIAGGNYQYISGNCQISDRMKDKYDEFATQGKTPLLFSMDNIVLGIIAVSDVIKKDSPDAIAQLKNLGLNTVMLTGDHQKTAKVIGDISGVDEIVAEVLPQDKEQKVRELLEKGKTAMVGDGINDAPALTRADIGIAISEGSDIAIDAADIVLMKNSLFDVVASIRLGRAVLKNIHENLFWAFIYNIIGIPLAAGVFYPLFGWELNPMIGAAAMSLSSFCVVTNALRLNFKNIYKS